MNPYAPLKIPDPPKKEPRLAVFHERHIGVGLRWASDAYMPFQFHISLALPFVTFEVGLGKRR